MNFRALLLAVLVAPVLTACYDLTRTGSLSGGTLPPPVLLGGAPVTYSKAAYVDAFASGAMAQISASGWQSPNIILLAFADPTTASSNATIASALSTAASNRSASTSGNLTFLSIGGALVSPSSWPQSASTLAANITAQINGYNASLSGNNQVAGVDLDLENGFSSATVNSIAQAMHAVTLANGKPLLVSIAPQVVGVSGVNVDAVNPTNLGFSAGGINNNFGLALKNGFVDDVLTQTYNTGPTGIVLNNVTDTNGQIVNGLDESNVLFFLGISQALNNTVQTSCASATTLCIPSTSKIFTGEPVNQGAGGTYTIFNPSAPQAPPVQYNQASILTSLSSELTYMYATNPSKYSHITGVAVWQLGNDYAPKLYGDTFAANGGFSTKIFGAAAPPAGPSILLQLTNNGSSQAITTLITSVGLYYPFPAVNASAQTTWCTSALSSGTCPDSFILDTLGTGTFTVQVTSNGTAWICPAGGGVGAGGTVTLVTGRYNLQVNGDFKSCAFASF